MYFKQLCCKYRNIFLHGVSFQRAGKHISNMFTGLRNKIKEAGSDPTKLALSSPPQKITLGSAHKGCHSIQGSGSSMGSLSVDGVKEELVSSASVLKQDSSEIKLPDGKVRSVFSCKINECVFFGGNKITTFYHSTPNCSRFILQTWIKGFKWHLE
jgi:hypothetical protein